MTNQDTILNIKKLDLSSIKDGTIQRFWLHIVNNAIGEPIRIPIIVAKGAHAGPTLGLTAAVHGNELNGIPVIQGIFEEVDPQQLHGNIVGVLICNVPGLLAKQRYFNDNKDLNRLAPGSPNGAESQIYMHRLFENVISKFDYHVDLHTASFGRINSHYVRAKMDCPITSKMAKLQNAQIIVKKGITEQTIRSAATAMGIKSITVELRDPLRFQYKVINDSLQGIKNLIFDLKMLEGEIIYSQRRTLLCEKSSWIYTDEGGILKVYPEVGDLIKAGELVAEVSTIFGQVIKKYYSPIDSVVVGCNIDPLGQTGARIVHLGHEPVEITN